MEKNEKIENQEKMEKKPKGFGVAALTLGIISILTHIFWYMGLVTGILAIIFGAKSIKTNEAKTGKAGLILGIIGLSLTAFLYISFAAIIFLSNSFS